MENKTICHICRKDKTPAFDFESISTGYATDNDGNKVCFDCCGWEDKAYMVMEGKNTLYLTINNHNSDEFNTARKDFVISNWPGTYKTHCTYYRKGRHNITGSRYDVWFTGPDSMPWHGVQYGENTQIVHCKRIKGGN